MDHTDNSQEVGADYRIDPFLMSVLSSRLEAIIREMTNTVMRASRSAVIKVARDFSCGLLTYDHRLVCVEEGCPIHVTSLELTTKPITELFDDIAEGDAFMNNCPYTGCTHHADMTVCVPVYCDGEPLFWALARSHHADVGAPLPTTYLPHAATIYEEGMHFPCVRIQEGFEDKKDIVRMGLTKIRVSNIWYGDYQAQVGACRIAERRLQELTERYGKQLIKDFIEDWVEYGKRRAIAAIKTLPAGSWTYETKHDPVPGVAEDGVPVRVTVSVDPDEGMITVDARDNIDCVPGGINLSEACAAGSCRIGVFYNLDASIPHNEGSASRINVLLRDGCVVGRPKYPVGTSVATTNVNDRLINAVQCCFSKMGRPHGIAEGGVMQQAGMAVVSGVDTRNGEPYVNQMFIGLSGGPGLKGHDGWVTYEGPDGGAMIILDTIEIIEDMYPILVEGRWIEQDTLGAGEWDGAPGMTAVYGPIAGDMTVIYCSDGEQNPPKGVLGGRAAAAPSNWKRSRNGELIRLPAFHQEVLQPGENVKFTTCGGGGYGDPAKRDPALAAKAANRGWISEAFAKQHYNVALQRASNGITWEVDEEATAVLRG
jgi:N-methylhydantoinase B